MGSTSGSLFRDMNNTFYTLGYKNPSRFFFLAIPDQGLFLPLFSTAILAEFSIGEHFDVADGDPLPEVVKITISIENES